MPKPSCTGSEAICQGVRLSSKRAEPSDAMASSARRSRRAPRSSGNHTPGCTRWGLEAWGGLELAGVRLVGAECGGCVPARRAGRRLAGAPQWEQAQRHSTAEHEAAQHASPWIHTQPHPTCVCPASMQRAKAAVQVPTAVDRYLWTYRPAATLSSAKQTGNAAVRRQPGVDAASGRCNRSFGSAMWEHCPTADLPTSTSTVTFPLHVPQTQNSHEQSTATHLRTPPQPALPPSRPPHRPLHAQAGPAAEPDPVPAAGLAACLQCRGGRSSGGQ